MKKILVIGEDAGIIVPVFNKIFPFDHTNEALEYVEGGHTKGKVVVNMK